MTSALVMVLTFITAYFYQNKQLEVTFSLTFTFILNKCLS